MEGVKLLFRLSRITFLQLASVQCAASFNISIRSEMDNDALRKTDDRSCIRIVVMMLMRRMRRMSMMVLVVTMVMMMMPTAQSNRKP